MNYNENAPDLIRYQAAENRAYITGILTGAFCVACAWGISTLSVWKA